MADGLIGIDIQGVEAVQRKLQAMIDARMADRAADAVAKYLVDVFKLYPTEKYVSRAEAYPDAPAGPGWFSDKQRRWFFAALRSGALDLPYRRTQTLRNNWQIIGSGTTLIIVNDTPYAVHVMGDSQGALQSRMSERIGWSTLTAILQGRAERINRIVEGEVKKAIGS